MKHSLAGPLRAAAVAATLFVSASLFSGCANEELFAACPFDQTINANCDAGDSSARFTCVVEEHPQCPEDVCLSWRSSPSFCTRVCTPGGGDCPADATCATFDDEDGKFFCVPNSTFVSDE